MNPVQTLLTIAHLAPLNVAGAGARDGFGGENFFGYYFYFSQIRRARQDIV